MTAEVAVLNRLGVALAADSAVTLGPRRGKIYTSAEKLFRLAENAPVGIMTYGNAHFMEVPWETIIKRYRQQLDQTTYGTLKEYVDDFCRYLKENRTLFPPAAQEGHVALHAVVIFSSLLDDFKEALSEKTQRGSVDEDAIREVFDEVVSDHLEDLRDQEMLDVSNDLKAELRKQYSEEIAQSKDQILGDLPYDQGTSQKLTSVVVETLVRRDAFSRSFGTGIVISGFGENEVFPSIFELWTRGVAADTLLSSQENSQAIARDSNVAWIVPFAQKEMVATFMNGIDPYLQTRLVRQTVTLFRGVASIILEEVEERDDDLSEEVAKEVQPELDKLIRSAIGSWQNTIQERYSDPVMQVVESLPKEELAGIAESLINITKFKRRVSTQEESVGGPIDVALITKGDGFVWIKRKHYFDADLNPRFIGRVQSRHGGNGD